MDLSPATRRAAVVVAALAAAFHLWAAGISPFTALVQRPAHLLLLVGLAALGIGVRAGPDASMRRGRVDGAARAMLLVAALASCGWLLVEHEAVVRRIGAATPWDHAAGMLAILVVLELARRAVGWPLVVIAGLSLAYAWTGPWLPGPLAHRGYSPARLVEHLYLGTEGIWGVPLGVSADFVYLFVLFGALLEAAGGAGLLVALAARIAGRARGGPALTATFASAFMGSLSGSAVANVATTGALTIPVMKRAGFRPHMAAAIEAAASTGGQLMPPVMGAGAFILATWTGIPYARVALAALLPALLFYAALLFAVHLRAVRMDLPRGDALAAPPVLPRLHLLLPVVAIVVLLALGRSPARAAFWGIATAAVLALTHSETRVALRRWPDVLLGAAAGTVQVAAACACAGIVVGVASLTGIGLRMSELIVLLSAGQLPAALVLTAIGSIVLGMGLPTTAAYVVLAALGAPALVELGVQPLAAHLFIFYFGCISNVTPPVSLAAFAAAGIANAPPMRTAFAAMGLASTGFLVPFLFVYGPALLLDAPPLEVALAAATALAGVFALAAAVIGHARRPLAAWERALLGGAAITLIAPGAATDAAGLIALAGVLARPARRAAPAAAALLLAVGLSACSDGAPARRFLSVGTGGTGGIYYPLGGALASRLSATDTVRTWTAEVTGGSVENIQRVLSGEIDLGFAISTSVYEAYHGGQDFATPNPRLRVIAPLYPNLTHVLVGAGSGIADPGQLRGRRVSVGSGGSGTEQLARQLLEAHGLTYADMEPRFLSFSESAAALGDGAIDAAILSVGFPAAAVMEALRGGRATLLPIDTAVLRILRERHTYYSAGTIPAGAYPGLDTDVQSVSVLNWIVGRDDLEADVVTRVLDLLRDERDALRRAVDIAGQINLANLHAAPVPLHDAARDWLERSAER